jgi:ribosomal protein L40E
LMVIGDDPLNASAEDRVCYRCGVRVGTEAPACVQCGAEFKSLRSLPRHSEFLRSEMGPSTGTVKWFSDDTGLPLYELFWPIRLG